MQQHLSDNVSIKKVSETDTEGVFEIEGLYTGYGITVGNALRRILLSSLSGAAVTQVKIKGVGHEFSTIPNVMEDVVELCLNIKKLRFRMHTDEPQVLTLSAKGEKKVTAADIEANAQVDIIYPDLPIATLSSKNAELEIELTVERGLGYMPVEARKIEKLAIGVIALDAMFSPVNKVNFSVENMRVGDRTDFNRLRLIIGTDSSITPSSALKKATHVLRDHFSKIGEIEAKEIEVVPVSAPKKIKKATKAKSKK